MTHENRPRRNVNSEITSRPDDANFRGTEMTPDGGIVRVPQNFRTVQPDEIRGLQITDAQLAQVRHLGQQYESQQPRDQQLISAVEGFARRMGMQTTPQIVVASRGLGSQDIPDIGSGYTREGTPYIQINQAALRIWTPQQLAALMALETSRLRNGDPTAERAAAAINDPQLAFADTFRADRDAAGPMGVNNPRVLAEALAIGETYRIQMLRNAGAVDFRDPEHPPMVERQANLTIMQRNQSPSPQ